MSGGLDHCLPDVVPVAPPVPAVGTAVRAATVATGVRRAPLDPLLLDEQAPPSRMAEHSNIVITRNRDLPRGNEALLASVARPGGGGQPMLAANDRSRMAYFLLASSRDAPGVPQATEGRRCLDFCSAL